MAIHLKPFESSSIARIGFSSSEHRLHIQFKSGKRYEYLGVDDKTFVKLVTAESTGKAFGTLIRNGGFEFRQIELDGM